jgi:hypothetical protein
MANPKQYEDDDEYLGEDTEEGELEDKDFIDLNEDVISDEEPSLPIRFIGPTRTDPTQVNSATAQTHKDEIDPNPITETTSKWNPGFVVRKKELPKKS